MFCVMGLGRVWVCGCVEGDGMDERAVLCRLCVCVGGGADWRRKRTTTCSLELHSLDDSIYMYGINTSRNDNKQST